MRRLVFMSMILATLACSVNVNPAASDPTATLDVTETSVEDVTPTEVTITPTPSPPTPTLFDPEEGGEEPQPTTTDEPTQVPAPVGPQSLAELKALIVGAIGGGGQGIDSLEPGLTDSFSGCFYFGECAPYTGQDRINFIVNQIPIGQDIEIDPQVMQPPLNANYDPSSSFLSKGWINNGQGEAVLFYVVENGIYKWSGGLWSHDAFAVADYNFNVANYMTRVTQAVINRDWNDMQQLAPSDLKLLSQGGSLFPDQYDDSNSFLATAWLPPSANPSTISTTQSDPGNTYAAELGGSVFNCCGQNVVGAIKMNGWGANATGQAILVIIESGPDVFRWWGFYYEQNGF